MPRHHFDFSFDLESPHTDPADISADDLRQALQDRLDAMGDLEIVEACGTTNDVWLGEDADLRDYDWQGVTDQCPEESGLYLAELLDGTTAIAAYLALESADYWVRAGVRGQALDEVEITSWADLPAGYPSRPGGDRQDEQAVVYQWGPAWFWYDPQWLSERGPAGCHCGPFETGEAAAEDLAAHMVHSEKESIHFRHGKWWFWDEAQADEYGPFDTEGEAKKGLVAYCWAVGIGPDPSAEPLEEFSDHYTPDASVVSVHFDDGAHDGCLETYGPDRTVADELAAEYRVWSVVDAERGDGLIIHAGVRDDAVYFVVSEEPYTTSQTYLYS